MADDKQINSNYTQFYAERSKGAVYPTEFVVRTLLANYPGLDMPKPQKGHSILDVAFGDGRNTVLLCDMGLDVGGIEISHGIVDQTTQRLQSMSLNADLRVGRNNDIPWGDESFDYILACHCCYYCDGDDTIINNMKEYARVMKPGAYLIASVADNNSYIFQAAEQLKDGTSRIRADPYANRNGYRLHGFSNEAEIESALSGHFSHFSFGHASNNYYGVHEQVFWVVCQKV